MNPTDFEGSYAEQLQALLTFLVRKPIKDAVRAELRDQSRIDVDADSERPATPEEPTDQPTDSAGGVPTKLLVGALGVLIVGLAYGLRRRTNGQSDDTAETADRVTGPNTAPDGEMHSSPPAR